MIGDKMNKTPPFFKIVLLLSIFIFIIIILISTVNPVSLTVETDDNAIYVTGYPSSVLNTKYQLVNNSFENYCPLCHNHDCLEVGIKRSDEITCNKCGADYDFEFGADKTNNPRAFLKKAHTKIKIIGVKK